MKITTLIWALGFLVNPSATLTNLNEKGHKSTVGKKFYIFIVSNNCCVQQLYEPECTFQYSLYEPTSVLIKASWEEINNVVLYLLSFAT